MWPMMWTLSPCFSASRSCCTNHCSWPAGSVSLINNQLEYEERNRANIEYDYFIAVLTSFDRWQNLFAVISPSAPHVLWCYRSLPCHVQNNIITEFIISGSTKCSYFSSVSCACLSSHGAHSSDADCSSHCSDRSPVIKGGGKLTMLGEFKPKK